MFFFSLCFFAVRYAITDTATIFAYRFLSRAVFYMGVAFSGVCKSFGSAVTEYRR